MHQVRITHLFHYTVEEITAGHTLGDPVALAGLIPEDVVKLHDARMVQGLEEAHLEHAQAMKGNGGDKPLRQGGSHQPEQHREPRFTRQIAGTKQIGLQGLGSEPFSTRSKGLPCANILAPLS